MSTGKVRLYNNEQGIGIIINEKNEEIVVHEKGLIDEIKTGDLVNYEIFEGPKGKRAINVKLR